MVAVRKAAACFRLIIICVALPAIYLTAAPPNPPPSPTDPRSITRQAIEPGANLPPSRLPTLKLAQPGILAFIPHTGPYWSLGPVFNDVIASMETTQTSGPLFLRYHHDPRRTPPSELRIDVGFLMDRPTKLDPRFEVERVTLHEVAAHEVMGPHSISLSRFAGLYSWIDQNHLEPTGQLMEMFLTDPREGSKNQRVELQIPVQKAQPPIKTSQPHAVASQSGNNASQPSPQVKKSPGATAIVQRTITLTPHSVPPTGTEQDGRRYGPKPPVSAPVMADTPLQRTSPALDPSSEERLARVPDSNASQLDSWWSNSPALVTRADLPQTAPSGGDENHDRTESVTPSRVNANAGAKEAGQMPIPAFTPERGDPNANRPTVVSITGAGTEIEPPRSIREPDPVTVSGEIKRPVATIAGAAPVPVSAASLGDRDQLKKEIESAWTDRLNARKSRPEIRESTGISLPKGPAVARLAPQPLADMLASDNYVGIAERLVPDPDHISAPLHLWLGQLITRIDGLARGVERVYPGQGPAFRDIADALSVRYKAIATHFSPTDTGFVVSGSASTGQITAQKKQIMRELDHLLANISIKTVDPNSAIHDLIGILASTEALFHAANTPSPTP